MSVVNPRTTSYEFMGPMGAALVSVGLPTIVFSLYFGCSEQAGGCPPILDNAPERVLNAILSREFWKGLWDTQAALIYLGWYLYCVAAWAIIPGDYVQGLPLRTGGRKTYKINGTTSGPLRDENSELTPSFLAFGTLLLALGVVSGYIIRNGPEAFTFIYDKWVGFLTAALLNAFIQSVYVYVASFRQGSILALGGNSGNIIYDASICTFPIVAETDVQRPSQWFIGRELNPSIGSFDIKTFNEMRPGLILWVLINVSMLCEQAVRRGGFANVTDSMWLVVAFQSFYVFDSLYNEVSFPKSTYHCSSHFAVARSFFDHGCY